MKRAATTNIFFIFLLSFTTVAAVDTTNYDVIIDDFFSNIICDDSDNDDWEAIKYDLLENAPEQYIEALIHNSTKVHSGCFEGFLSLIDEAINAFPAGRNPQKYAKLMLANGIVYLSSGYYYEETYRCLTEAINLFDHQKELKHVALTYSQLGSLWRNLQEYETALEYCMKSEQFYRTAGLDNEALNMRLNACIIYLETENKDKVLEIINKDMPLAGSLNNNDYTEFLNVILGHYYMLTGKLDSAYIFFNKALSLTHNDSTQIISRRPYLLANIGEIFFEKGDYMQARAYLENSLPYDHQTNRLYMEGRVYAILSKIYEHYGENDKAFSYLKESVLLNDSVAIQEKANQIQRVKSRNELMDYSRQLQIAKQQSEIKQANLFVMILTLTLVLLIILFILLYINRKKSLKEMENEQLAQQLKNKEIKSQLEQLEHEAEIDKINRKMATTQLLNTEKSKMLEHLLQTFQPFYNDKKIPEEIWKEMKAFVSSGIRQDNEWDKSKIHFENVHPSFFKKLKEVAPNLTENEMRVCAYVKIGMKTKQIADIMSINQRSVIVSRHRIKKKLDMDENMVLDDFIRNV